LFDLGTVDLEAKFNPHDRAVTAVTFSRDGRVIVSANSGGQIVVSSASTGMTVRVITDHKGSPVSGLDMALAPVGGRMLGVLVFSGWPGWLISRQECKFLIWFLWSPFALPPVVCFYLLVLLPVARLMTRIRCTSRAAAVPGGHDCLAGRRLRPTHQRVAG